MTSENDKTNERPRYPWVSQVPFFLIATVLVPLHFVVDCPVSAALCGAALLLVVVGAIVGCLRAFVISLRAKPASPWNILGGVLVNILWAFAILILHGTFVH